MCHLMAVVLSSPRLLLPTCLAAALLTAASGCVSSEIVKRSDRLDEGTKPALLATYQVELGRTERGGGLAMTGGQLAAFGQAALPLVQAAFAELGVQLEFDLKAAKVLDAKALLRPSNKLSTLTGVWTHPEVSAYRFDYPTRGSDSTVAQVLAAVDEDRPYFASVTLFIDEQQTLPASRAPLVRVSARVLDRDGKPVLFARTEGAGRSMALFADRSHENLLTGLDVALGKLATMKRTPY